MKHSVWIENFYLENITNAASIQITQALNNDPWSRTWFEIVNMTANNIILGPKSLINSNNAKLNIEDSQFSNIFSLEKGAILYCV